MGRLCLAQVEISSYTWGITASSPYYTHPYKLYPTVSSFPNPVQIKRKSEMIIIIRMCPRNEITHKEGKLDCEL